MTLPVDASRRDWLKTASLAAAGGLVAEVCSAQARADEIIADKHTRLKITGLRTWRVHPKVFLRLETNLGLEGWGEISAVEPTTARALADSMFDLLDGENPTRIEHLWQRMYRAHRNLRGGPLMVHTIAGIDMALWDLAGKLHGVPVYTLLGGPCRDRIRVYRSPKAIKVPNPGIFEHSSNPTDVQRVAAAVQSARQAVGPDGAVMFDAHCALPPATLIQVAGALEPYDVLFLEEPAVPGNIEVFKRLKEQIRIPLATGERDRTIWGMIPYLVERCIDVLQPDCAHTGGISQMRKIAALAEAFFVPLAPHNTCSYLGLAASLHAVAAVPLFLIHEAHPDNAGFNPPGAAHMPWQIDAEGYVGLPPGPGLGVEIDLAVVEKADKNPPPYRWRGATLRDGSVADY